MSNAKTSRARAITQQPAEILVPETFFIPHPGHTKADATDIAEILLERALNVLGLLIEAGEGGDEVFTIDHKRTMSNLYTINGLLIQLDQALSYTATRAADNLDGDAAPADPVKTILRSIVKDLPANQPTPEPRPETDLTLARKLIGELVQVGQENGAFDLPHKQVLWLLCGIDGLLARAEQGGRDR